MAVIHKIRLLFYKIKYHFFPRFSKNGEFNYILENSGIHIGKGTIFYGPKTIQIDRSRPYLLSIGEYCKITSGVVILTHDYSRSVLRRAFGEVVGEGEKTIIGNNVFIGMNAIILMGTHIGNNVIIGAGSVVKGIFPDNVVIAGNPARIIRTLEEHYIIKKKQMLLDAKECVQAFYTKYGRIPTVSEVDPFWPLFLSRNIDVLKKTGVKTNLNGDDEEDLIKSFLKTKPYFSSFEDFLSYCGLV